MRSAPPDLHPLRAQPVFSPLRALPALLLVAALAGCASGSRGPAPVEDRALSGRPRADLNPPSAVGASSPRAAPAESRALLGAENAGKPGYYTVKPGDTLVRIGLDSGHNWRDLARWNRLENPNLIEVGQVIRVAPPVGESVMPRAAQGASPVQSAQTPANPTAGASPAASTSGVTTSPVTASQLQAQAMGPVGAASGPTALPPLPPASAVQAPRAPEAGGTATPAEDEVAWAWPIAGGGNLLAGFDEVRNKGLDIGGKAGDPVLAAADGRVVYAGAGLRGYGNLVILKHNNTYLTAYAHNQTLLVKEDQVVRKGQRIAEMGSTDADRVKLHFEIRRQGKPVDPAKLLPPR